MLLIRPQILLLVAFSLLCIASCGTVTPDSSSQYIADVAWQGTTGEAILADQASRVHFNDPIEYFLVGTADIKGNIQQVFSNDTLSSYQGGPLTAIFTNTSGSQGVFESPDGISRVDLHTGARTLLLPSYHLAGASSDAQLIAATRSRASESTKAIELFDIATNTPRKISTFNLPNTYQTRALWMNGRFGFTQADTIGFHVSVYDTLGNLVVTIPNASAQLHASAYALAADQLICQTNSGQAKLYDFKSQQSTVLEDSVNSMDISPDGSVMAFTSTRSSLQNTVQSLNVLTKAKATLGDNGISVFISPDATKVAYIHIVDTYHQDLQVTTLVKP